MFFMFAIFGSGILFVLIFISPVLFIIEKISGFNPVRMQNVFRFFFTIWLFLMRTGRLLKSLPPRGELFDGPCIIIANHPGLFDVLFLIRDVPGLSVLVKRSLALKLPIGPLLRLAGYVLSPDNRTISPIQSLQNAVDKLNMGNKFQLFPEGTRSPSGNLLPFNAGAFKMAQKLDVPVQPVFIKNIPPFLGKKSPWYLPPQEISVFEMEIWEPINISEKDNVRTLTKEIERRYREALGY